MSTHRVDVVTVKLESHPNADTLSIVRPFGYTVCVRTADWSDGDLGAYIPPDSVVDSSRPEFAFLAGHERIKVKKLRGIVSQGLLVKAPPGSKEGDDVMEALGVQHYDPPEAALAGGEATSPPPGGWRPTYDVESWHRYGHLLVPGELVYVTEKLHGASGRWCFVDGQFHCGSRTEWKRESTTNFWWRAIRQYPGVVALAEANPRWTLYGEVFGCVQDLHYAMSVGQVAIRLFDAWNGGGWVSHEELRQQAARHGADLVPMLLAGPYDPTVIASLAEGRSTLAGHVREGCVIKPQIERTHPEIGRVQLKIVGNGYLEKA